MIYRIFITIAVLAVLAAAIIINNDSKGPPASAPVSEEPNLKGLKIE